MTQEVNAVKVEETRNKVHNFTLNVEEQVKRKVQHAGSVMLKVERSDDVIKIRPNSGNFKVLSEEMQKIKVGEKITTKEAVAIVTDQVEQTDIKGISHMTKTEFNVTVVTTGISQKAVMHTYTSQTYFMIQGNGTMKYKLLCKDFFFDNIIKQFIKVTMENRGKEIRIINQSLKAQTKTAKAPYASQWKRKLQSKEDQCDICSPTFANLKGVSIRKKKVHGSNIIHKKKVGFNIVKLNTSLVRSDSGTSVCDGSRPSSPSPKKIHHEKKEENIKESYKYTDNKSNGDMEQSAFSAS